MTYFLTSESLFQAGQLLAIEPSFSLGYPDPQENAIFRKWADGDNSNIGFHASECARQSRSNKETPLVCLQWLAVHSLLGRHGADIELIAEQNNKIITGSSDWIASYIGLIETTNLKQVREWAHGFLLRDTFLSYLCAFSLMAPIMTNLGPHNEFQEGLSQSLIETTIQLTQKDSVPHLIPLTINVGDEIERELSMEMTRLVASDILRSIDLKEIMREFCRFYLNYPNDTQKEKIRETLKLCRSILEGHLHKW